MSPIALLSLAPDPSQQVLHMEMPRYRDEKLEITDARPVLSLESSLGLRAEERGDRG